MTFNGNSVGNTTTYSCNTGFELIGDSTTICTQIDANSAEFPVVPPPECRREYFMNITNTTYNVCFATLFGMCTNDLQMCGSSQLSMHILRLCPSNCVICKSLVVVHIFSFLFTSSTIQTTSLQHSVLILLPL